MTQTEALKLADDLDSEFAQGRISNHTGRKAAQMLRALAHPEQEPVAYGMWDSMIGCGGRMMYVRLDKGQDGCTVPLYTTPPQRKPLTDDNIWDSKEIMAANGTHMQLPMSELIAVVRAVEAAHGIKE